MVARTDSSASLKPLDHILHKSVLISLHLCVYVLVIINPLAL